MAPLHNIALSIYERWPDRKCQLFFGCRTAADVFYLDEYRELAAEHPNFKVVYALSEPQEEDGEWKGETGFIHLSAERHLGETDARRQAFLCGPPPMIEAVMKVLEAKGFRPEDIFYDEF
jgi:Na+-transporting NADH:ubiquinone oxidoreductase subunit F